MRPEAADEKMKISAWYRANPCLSSPHAIIIVPASPPGVKGRAVKLLLRISIFLAANGRIGLHLGAICANECKKAAGCADGFPPKGMVGQNFQ